MADATTEAPAAPATTASETVSTVAAPESQSAAPTTEAPVTGTEVGKEAPAEGDASKPADGKTADKPAESAAPAEYTDFKVPEGVVIDAAALTEFKDTAKELGLTQEQAQKVADLGTKQAQSFAAQLAQSQKDAAAQWATETTSDKEIGGDALPENLAIAKKALDTYGTPALKALLVKSGLGNHPEIIRTFVKVGKTISEDKFVSGSAGKKAADTPIANRIYPNQK